MDERTLRIAVLLAAHVIFLSAAALRIVRGSRAHQLVARSAWWITYYPPLVWLPFLVAYVFPVPVEIDRGLRIAGLAVCWLAAIFGAWAMWSLGRGYGIKLDVFEGAALKTDGPYAISRHPMYLGILVYHLGAILALESALLAVATIAYVLPLTAARIAAEDSVLAEAFGERYAAYRRAVPALVPLPRL